MKIKILLLLSILGIFVLLTLSIFLQKPIIQGKISSINQKTKSISIYLENNSTEIILFTNKLINIQKQDNIQVYGKQEAYRNKTQIIANKIILIK